MLSRQCKNLFDTFREVELIEMRLNVLDILLEDLRPRERRVIIRLHRHAQWSDR